MNNDARTLHKPEDIAAELQARVAAMLKQSRAHAAQWDAWYGAGHAVACPEHPAYPLTLDRDASHAKSWTQKENVVVFLPCPLCQASIIACRDREFLDGAGVPTNLHHASFNNWTPRTEQDARILKRCQAYAKNPAGALLLLGRDFGVGKTHLAVAVLRMLHRGRFISHGGFVKKLRDGYKSDRAEDIVDSCIRVSFLVIDDLGITSGGRDELPNLHLVLDERKGMGRPFVLTANASRVSELAPVLGERMLDRLMDYTFDALVLAGESWRKPKKLL